MHVKVCCIASVDEARLAIDAGAAALGLVSAMPSGPGPIDEALIAEIAAAVPPPTETFLLTSLQRAEAIVAQHRRCGTSVLQLVDALADEELKPLRAVLPHVKLVQVVHVTGPGAVDEALAVAPFIDALLLDRATRSSRSSNSAAQAARTIGRTAGRLSIGRRCRCGWPVA